MSKNKLPTQKQLSLPSKLKKKFGIIGLILTIILFAHVFFRFYGMESMSPYGWDQVDNSWAAKTILVDHELPLVGMVAKQNTGFFIGPAYYYYATFFYWIFNLDPIAAIYAAAVASIITFFVMYSVTKRIFSKEVAILGLAINALSYYVVSYDRIQWPINFIPLASLIIFYSLFRIIKGDVKYIILLAIGLGFSFHLNFTAVFFPLIVICALPFFPFKRGALKYYIYGIGILFLSLVPNIIYELLNSGDSSRKMGGYLETYYHGLHVRRILQLAGDAFIDVGAILKFKELQFLKYLVFPIFCVLYLRRKLHKDRIVLCYLIGLWFLVPWMVFSVYSGEITNYYFSLTRPIATILISYILISVFYRNVLLKVVLVVLFFIYAYYNISLFFQPYYRPMAHYRAEVIKAIKNGEEIEFQQGVPEAYFYYFYTAHHDK